MQESVEDINSRIPGQFHLHRGEVLPFFRELIKKFWVRKVFSYQETGLWKTYERDIRMSAFFTENDIRWIECRYAGVIRGAKDRTGWRKHWYQVMNQGPDMPEISRLNAINLEEHFYSPPERIPESDVMQKGGSTEARKVLESFLNQRSENYNRNISKPLESRDSCSRLSPYIAWGNISVREIYQAASEKSKSSKRRFTSFLSRLRWHCHFIQKFEAEGRYEAENLNRGYNIIRNEWNEDAFQSWKNGQTGFPLVDACIRCVTATGYLNFRMRAMLVSFLTHHLWLDWKHGADWLASMFLDFEPGIHYPQFQMQAGVTGINTIRIYNPVKQGYDHYPEGRFIVSWVRELEGLPVKYRHEPWKMSPIEQQMYGVQLGKDYPFRIVDHRVSYKRASTELYRIKSDPIVKKEAGRILRRHTVKGRVV